MEALEITKKLIKFPSHEDNPEGIKKCINFCEEYFSKNNINYKKYKCGLDGEVEDKKVSLVASPVEDPKVFLCGHLDVVDGDGGQFNPREENDILYGRGALDMKGAIAIYLSLMKEFSIKEEKPKLGLILTSDEEIGGERGMRHLIHDIGLSFKFGIVGESTDLDIACKEKGVLQYRISEEGISAHGSRPYEGNNAIDKLKDKIDKLRGKWNKATPKNFWSTSMNLGDISVEGGKPNVVPNNCDASIDIRYIKEKQKEKIQSTVENLFSKKDLLLNVSLMKTNPKNEWVKKLKESRSKIINKEQKKEFSYVFSDGRYLAEAGIPVVSFGLTGSGEHGPEEKLITPSLKKYRSILSDFIENNL